MNALRQRAYGNTSGNITDAELTLHFILDERGRELLWEAHRRTDLVRYGLFTGGTYSGRGRAAWRPARRPRRSGICTRYPHPSSPPTPTWRRIPGTELFA